VHLRPPSSDHGVISFIWGVGLGLFVWIGLRAVGVENATAFVIACVSAFAIFLVVRIYGEEEPRRP
jgi:lipopolysaccharide export LptBFGC system permease protein LptF